MEQYNILREEFMSCANEDAHTSLLKRKREENTEDGGIEEFVWHAAATTSALEDIKLELEFVETSQQRDLWRRLHATTSSMVYKRNPGRTVLLFVKDSLSGLYLGLLSLASDMCNMGVRDKYIGWTRENKYDNKRLNHIYNINVCVPLQPFGFNYKGGKLLAMLCFTSDVCDYLKNKYGDTPAGFCTTSLYGKSIQYDRLKCLKYLGMTSGYGHVHISDSLYQRGVQYLRENGNGVPSCAFDAGSNPKMRRIGATLRALDLPRNLLRHEQKRGVYFGYTSEDSKAFLCGQHDVELNLRHLPTAQETFDTWLHRYALPRIRHLHETKRFRGI